MSRNRGLRCRWASRESRPLKKGAPEGKTHIILSFSCLLSRRVAKSLSRSCHRDTLAAELHGIGIGNEFESRHKVNRKRKLTWVFSYLQNIENHALPDPQEPHQPHQGPPLPPHCLRPRDHQGGRWSCPL